MSDTLALLVPADRLWLYTGLGLLALMVPTLVARAVDARTLNGASVWSKPLKFQASIAMHFLTLWLAAQLLGEAQRSGIAMIGQVWLSTLAGIGEIAIITLRAAQGRASHFNAATPLDRAVYTLMGIGAVILLAPAATLGLHFLATPESIAGSPALKLGIGLGFTGGAILTLVTAGYMGAHGSHFARQPASGGPLSDAGAMALTGWSRIAGDLRVGHFFATHMMQIVPLAGLAGARAFGTASPLSLYPVWIAFGVMAALSLATFAQALMNRPFLR